MALFTAIRSEAESSSDGNTLRGKERIDLYCTLETEKATRGSLGNTVRHKRGADSFVDALFPMNEISSTRHLYPQVDLRMQKDVEICKSGRIERRRSASPGPRLASVMCSQVYCTYGEPRNHSCWPRHSESAETASRYRALIAFGERRAP